MKLALGTAQFGLDYGIANGRGQIPATEAASILDKARECGMDTLDTAIAYGSSERRLGDIGVNGWRVVSKLPAIQPEVADIGAWVREAVDASLERLRIDALHALLLHRPHQLLEARGDELYRALLLAKARGVVRKIGISIYAPAELSTIADAFEFDIVQAPFSIVDRRMLDSGWLERLAGRRVEIHVRSIFLQGLLLFSATERPARFARWGALWAQWDKWCRDERLTPVEACLRYALSMEEVDRVVVGVDSLAQLKTILRSVAGPLPSPPESLSCTDDLLINPGRWPELDAADARVSD